MKMILKIAKKEWMQLFFFTDSLVAFGCFYRADKSYFYPPLHEYGGCFSISQRLFCDDPLHF